MPEPLIERYRQHLSLEDDDPVVTLHEGSTPLVHAPRLIPQKDARGRLAIPPAWLPLPRSPETRSTTHRPCLASPARTGGGVGEGATGPALDRG